MASRALESVTQLIELAELRARAERVLSAEERSATFVTTGEQKYLGGVRQVLDDELEDAWLRTVACLDEEGYPIEALGLRAGLTGSSEQAAAQAQADASGRRVRYGKSIALPVRNSRLAARSAREASPLTGDLPPQGDNK